MIIAETCVPYCEDTYVQLCKDYDCTSEYIELNDPIYLGPDPPRGYTGMDFYFSSADYQ